jgi:hypothetical protein
VTVLAACSTSQSVRTITLADLEVAAPAPTHSLGRTVVSDADHLREICTPLGSRLGLLEVRTSKDWQQLARLAPTSAACPDLRRGIVVGIVCWAGLPVHGHWPVVLDSIHVCDGGGLVNATFEPGTYLPDGTTYLETAYVEGLNAVLAVNVNGTTFYPD